MRNTSRLGLGHALGCLGLVLIAGVALAQTMSDFENTAGEKGCESIPYADLREECIDKQEGVEDYCKNVKLSCDDVDPEGLQTNVENMKGKVSDLKDEKDDLEESKRNLTDSQEISEAQAAIDQIAAKIRDLEDKISRDTSTVYDEQNRIRERISNGERCLEFRIAVWEVFKNAKTKVRDAATSSDSDPAIKPHAERLIREWEAEEEGHEKAIFDFKEMVDKCKNML